MEKPILELSGRWRIRVRIEGLPQKSKTFRTQKLAKQWAIRTENELLNQQISGNALEADYSVNDLLHWYERAMSVRKKGWETESIRIATLTRLLGQGQLCKLSPQLIIGFVDTRLKSVCSDTVRRELTVLSAAIEAGIALKDFKLDNPVRIAVKKLGFTNTLTSPVERERRLVGDEYNVIVGHLKENNPLMADIVMLLVETAMRRGELINCQDKNLSEQGLLITDDKTGKTTVIPISQKARAILKRYPDGFGIKVASISQCFRRTTKTLGIDDLHLHDLRHEATSRLFERGLHIQQVCKITRHSNWDQLKKYTHPTNREIQRLLD